MIEDIQAAIPLGLLLSFMIGPVFFVLLETSAIKGFRAALCFDLGVIVADIIFISLAYFSSFQLLENLRSHPGLYVFGGTILLVYGLTNVFKKESLETENQIRISKGDYFSLCIKGFLLNFINIGVLVFWLGIIIVVGPSLDNDPSRIIIFFSTMLGAYFITDILKILLAKQLRKKLTKRRILLVKKGIGIVLVICGLVLIIKGFLPKDQLNIEKGIELIK
ncbi:MULTISPECIES: LysE family translocator [unclassified Arenibacter]|uniref:LysE family translocator n=1 Tax=unclassified Arenibacter TaxID=2615047 RepID=UPI000E355871|nr:MULTISPECIES: LysE family transporter [unclassified Arenibacter]MCM4165908.1 lysine transporter LysE [Arenibacter sp. A80]RFT54418.1 LysE family translocator [Arenibacter sp. P308M17]